MTIQDKLQESLTTALLDSTHPSDEELRISLLSNIPGRHKVLEDIERELASCTSFAISVAFITLGGITPLLQTLKELEDRDIPGRILTTDYLHFTEPKALQTLARLRNLDVRLYRTRQDSSDGFHTKGYIFCRTSPAAPDGTMHLIIGSSNLTDKALSVSREWNTRLVSLGTGEFARGVLREFDALWEHAQTMPLAHVYADYEAEYRACKAQLQPPAAAQGRQNQGQLPRENLVPNAMQQAFLERLRISRQQGRRRALLISATGTGKTFAAAFAIRDMQPARLLFVVHREQIARQARASFMRVLGGDAGDYGLLSGTAHDRDCRYVFATMQTLVRHLEDYAPDSFPVIIVDEVHRAGAASYQRIMRHFAPDFWLGMTGSPDRPDGFDIYGLFDYNIVYEIRLQEAMKHDLLCPFHYFGIGGLTVTLDTMTVARALPDTARLAYSELVRQVREKADYFGYCGERLKGLVFASSSTAARGIAAELNAQGRRALALSGDDSQRVREDAVRRLTQDSGDDCLDYLVTVDIFNEGVDIPEVNQIVFLRPTQSPIIFVQQLGRGLRKYRGKDFVVVLDFIGNYESNYLIPVALSGDMSYNKNAMRRVVQVESRHIPGISTIHFDAVARERIYRAIDRANTGSLALLKDAYFALKNKLGRIPELTDYEEHGQIDAVKFLQKPAGYSYYAFRVKVDSDYDVRLSEDAAKRIVWLSRKLGSAVRPSEALLIQGILAGEQDLKGWLRRRLQEVCGYAALPQHLRSVEEVLCARFERTRAERERWQGMEVLTVDEAGCWQPAQGFVQALQVADFRSMVENLCTFICTRWQQKYGERYADTMLSLKAAYTYDDVCRLLDWEVLLPSQNIGGYFYHATTRTLPVFINYVKPDDAIPYEDRFVSRQELVSLSKTCRQVDSDDARRMMRQHPYEDTRIFLFVRKNKEDREAKSFYFLGEMDAAGSPSAVTLPGGRGPAFTLHWKLRQPVEAGLYEYLTGEEA